MATETRTGSGLLGFNDSNNARRKPWLLSADDNYVHWYAKNTPVVTQNDGTVGSVTDTEVNVWGVGNGYVMESYNIGTQGAAAPAITASGLNIAVCANADGIGLELGHGITASARSYMTVGSSGYPLLFKVKFKLQSVNSFSQCFMGFRKAGAYGSTYTDYADYAILGMVANAGDIVTRTAVGGTDASAVDTTLNWAAGETHTLAMRVSPGGAVSWYVDGLTPAAQVNATTSYVFTNALNIIPFFTIIRNATNPTNTVEIIEWECGFDYTLFNFGTGGF